MKSVRFIFILFVLLTGCQTGDDTVPLFTAEAARPTGESVSTLREGRALFVRRCIECHALPVVSRHSVAAWPHIVAGMSARADLKPAEQAAITAYIIALRKQQQ